MTSSPWICLIKNGQFVFHFLVTLDFLIGKMRCEGVLCEISSNGPEFVSDPTWDIGSLAYCNFIDYLYDVVTKE